MCDSRLSNLTAKHLTVLTIGLAALLGASIIAGVAMVFR